MKIDKSFNIIAIKRTRFRKQHRGRMKGKSCRGNRICFGRYALQALEPAWITARQIFPDKLVTLRPTETRTGSGKGSLGYWVSVVKLGRILYEMGGVSETVARAAISIAASKMPIRSQFIRLEI
ncbi:unnamed protein product [Triticum turgidum subsp. durum]|uniref:50S ribosomal protein L16, chloroplastic n=1 Tax=Triticum turgidum subsp. durum TaxID=4567 RepID=A0A9R0VQQ3_TRITD|nr:unnamed protein product [Triticum turgidum subsp. durum]